MRECVSFWDAVCQPLANHRAIVKILIEYRRFHFYENIRKTHFDIWEKQTQRKNGVFNGFC